MASGDTDVGICNKALLLLGSSSITSFTDGTPQGSACSVLYPDVKRITMGMYPWSFSVAKAQLTRQTATPNNEWTYQFTLPNDMLNGVPKAVRTSASAGSSLYKNWEIGQATDGSTVLMTESTTIYIDYQKAIAESLMPHYFVQLLGYQMAWHLAEVITDQTTKSQYWREVALGSSADSYRGGFFRQACSIDSGGQTPSVVGDYLITDVRA